MRAFEKIKDILGTFKTDRKVSQKSVSNLLRISFTSLKIDIKYQSDTGDQQGR